MTEIVKLHTIGRGDGFPVVMLHGFPFDHTIWQTQTNALSQNYRVITPDLRGHGQSPAPEGVYTMDALAGDVLALLDDLKIERAVWIGHSMGGYATMAALRLAPERIAGVGLVATQPFADAEEKRAGRLKSAEQVLTEGNETLVTNMLGVLFGPDMSPGSLYGVGVRSIMKDTPINGIVGSLRGMAERPDSAETLRGMRVPAVVIAGTDDQIVAFDVARQMAEMMPHAQFVTIERAGHLLMIEQPEVTTDALRKFLQSL